MSASKRGKDNKKNASGSRTDPGWVHGLDIDPIFKKVQCKYCKVIRSGGIFRLKHHLACTHQNVEPCPQVPDDVRQEMFDLLSANSEESRKKKKKFYDVGDVSQEHEKEVDQMFDMRKGSMDEFVVRGSGQGSRQTTINEKWRKQERDQICQLMARWFYTSAIPFNAVNNPLFSLVIKKMGEFGKGLKPPSYHEMRVTFLKKEVQETLNILQKYKEQWKKTGCSIMSDGWTDKRKRSMANFLVNSPAGTVFLHSVDTTDVSKTAKHLFELLDDVVDKVGEDNVVQIVTDNASNYKAAGKLLMEKRKRLFWTPCAAHCIDLMLEDLEKNDVIHKVTIAKARKVVSYIYSWDTVVNWMKQFTKGKELIRPGVTRFATAYLTMRRLSEQRGALYNFFTSDKWKESVYARRKKGKEIYDIVFDNQGFWANLDMCLKVASPLIKVLRMVDSDDKPAMAFLYKAIDQAKEEIKVNVDNVQRRYEKVFEIIDKRWEDQLGQPLHAAGYFLNPQFQYSPDFQSDVNVKRGLYDCISRMVADPNERLKIDMQIDYFRDAKGLFGIQNAILTRNKKAPADWWESYGDECPELKRFAIRILSLTCSSSGCERNWSAFELVHSKRRNRLAQKMLNDLVFVMYNLKLQERQRQRQRQSICDEVPFEDLPSDDEWITERENPALPQGNNWLKILEDNPGNDTSDEEQNENEVEVITRNLKRALDHDRHESRGHKRQANQVNEVHAVDDDEDEGSPREFHRGDDDYHDMVPEDSTQGRTNISDENDVQEESYENEINYNSYRSNWGYESYDMDTNINNNDLDMENLGYGDDEYAEDEDEDDY